MCTAHGRPKMPRRHLLPYLPLTTDPRTVPKPLLRLPAGQWGLKTPRPSSFGILGILGSIRSAEIAERRFEGPCAFASFGSGVEARRVSGGPHFVSISKAVQGGLTAVSTLFVAEERLHRTVSWDCIGIPCRVS